MHHRFRHFALLLFLLLPFLLQAGQPGGVRTVVIDAGHGGHDPGALGLKGKEKNINLAIALKLAQMIRSGSPGVKVILTRDKDVFVELFRRAAIANEARADLFISIHCNANPNRDRRGAETYIMGLHKSKANLAIAKQENAAILLESDYRREYDGFDPNSDESYILFSLNQNLNLDRSTDFAAAIQAQLVAGSGRSDHGVRQAGFLVLYRTTMPSVLVESGYLSNAEEEKFLLTEKGQESIASAIYKAFRSTGEPGKAGDDNPAPPKTDPLAKQDSHRQASVSDDSAEQAKKPPVETPKEKPQPKPQPEKAAVSAGALSWRVQIAAETRDIGTNATKFKPFGEVKMYRHNGMYKYTVGNEPDKAAVLKLLDRVKSLGAKDAFVVIFRDGVRIPTEEADRLLRNKE